MAPSSTLMAGPNVVTEAVWFKTTSTSGGRLIGFSGSQLNVSSNYDRQIWVNNAGNVVFGVYPTVAKTVASSSTYNNGAWHFAAASLSAGGMALYVEGVLVASDATTTSAQSFSGYWEVGYDSLANWGTNTPTNYGLTGSLGYASVYLSALTAAQIQTLYLAGK